MGGALVQDVAQVRALRRPLATAAGRNAGRIVDLRPVERLLTAPVHPYTFALMNATPDPDPTARRN